MRVTLLIPHVVPEGIFDLKSDPTTLVVASVRGGTGVELFSKAQHTFLFVPSNPQKDFLRKTKTCGICLSFSKRYSNLEQRLISTQTPFSKFGVLHYLVMIY